jgi:hypothetical protein
MSSMHKEIADRGPFEIIEESFHLLRSSPFRAPASYFMGSLPFVIGLLYFWAEMSRSALAYQHLARNAFLMAILFIWMKTWQAIYARELWAQVRGIQRPKWSAKRIFRMAMRQAALQPAGLFILPLALVTVVPFGRTYAWFENLTVLDDGSEGDVKSLMRRAADLAGPWQKQNLVLIWALSPYLMATAAGFFLVILPVVKNIAPEWTGVLLGLYSAVLVVILLPLSPFGVIVAANIAMALLIIPFILKSLLGVHTVFASSPQAMLNSTFFAVVCGLTYLCMDPLMKAAYVLRCFYIESIQTGEDIKVQLKHLTEIARAAVVLLILLAGLFFSGNATAKGDAPGVVQTDLTVREKPMQKQGRLSISPEELDQALTRELKERRYTWRMPRPALPETDQGPIAMFLTELADTIRDLGKAILNAVRKVLRRLKKHMPEYSPGKPDGRRLGEWSFPLRMLLFFLLAVLLSIAGVYAYRIWKRREGKYVKVIAEAVAARPDLLDESTTGEDLPEQGWLAMAQELMQKGEMRLALRAVFLATLVILSERGLIQIERFKSNLDYKRELERRAHELPEVLNIFSQSVMIYESIWYGMHQATRQLLDRVMIYQERLRASG